MLDMRIRLPELLTEYETNAYALATASKGRLAANTVYKLVAKQGVVRYLDARTLQAIYETLGLKSLNELLSPDPPPPRVNRKRKARAA
jgi:hypothetical protein